MAEKITHQHTTRPYYEAEAQHRSYVRDWTSQQGIDHTVDSNRPDEIHPVVLDIETTAETPQKPILVTVYDSKINTLYVNYSRDYCGFAPDDDELAHLPDRFESHGYDVDEMKILYGPNMSWFENRILRPIAHDDGRVLVAHNALFDLGILARPDDGLLQDDRIDDDKWDGAFQYKNIITMHHKAGAFGRLYGMYDIADGFEPMHVPIADTSTVAKSMHLSGSLEGACDDLGIDYTEAEGEHGVLDMSYVEYNVDDVAATLDLYWGLRERLAEGFNTDLPLSSVYSTASIAKDVLERMNYDRVHYTADALDVIAPSFFGGNTEAIITGELVEGVTYMDILSQYPTVSALTDVWRFMQAQEVDIEQVDPDVLPTPSIDELQQQAAWRDCADYYVVLEADDELLPVRTQLDTTDTTRVYNARVTHETETIHHYFDYLAAQLHADGEPDIEIKAAYRAVPSGRQQLTSAQVGGTTIEAYDNIMQRGIEERKAKQAEYGGKNKETKSLKIMANSSYGITAERNVIDIGDWQDSDHERHDVAGKYYNPHCASTITAGGRLQLALGEAAAEAAGGHLVYCDTDSLIVPDGVADDVLEAFSGLNPYTAEPVASADVLEVEDTKHPDTGDEIDLAGVQFFAVGEKKYAVLNEQGEIIKFTEHGLGHYKNLRDSGRIRRFWASVMDRVPADIEVVGDRLSDDVLDEPVLWQDSASTAVTRQLLSQKLDVRLRYGDFIERTISKDDGSQYLGIDVTESAIEITADGDLNTDVQIDETAVKTVRQVVDGMSHSVVARSLEGGARPAVIIESKQVVTKEASDVTGAWDEMLAKLLDQIDIDWLW